MQQQIEEILLMLTIYGPNVRRQRGGRIHPTQAQSINSLQHRIVVVVTAAILGARRRQVEVGATAST